MKKENVMKFLAKSAIGFFVGVTLLMIAYASVFFIFDEGTFISEISQLQNVTTLIVQIIAVGLAYCIVSIWWQIEVILLNVELNRKEEYKNMLKHPYICIFKVMIICIVLISIIIYLLENDSIYSETIRFLNLIILMIIYGVMFLVLSVKAFKEGILIRKINQKLKEKNK